MLLGFIVSVICTKYKLRSCVFISLIDEFIKKQANLVQSVVIFRPNIKFYQKHGKNMNYSPRYHFFYFKAVFYSPENGHKSLCSIFYKQWSFIFIILPFSRLVNLLIDCPHNIYTREKFMIVKTH